MSVWGHVYLSAVAHRDRKRVSYPLELELQAVVSHLVWVRGTELESFAREWLLLTSESSPAPGRVFSAEGTAGTCE